MKNKSVVQKLTQQFGGSWVYISTRGFWINNKGRYALSIGDGTYVSKEGKYAPAR